MRRTVILGSAALAKQMAAACSVHGPTLLGSKERPKKLGCLWFHADLQAGVGSGALRNATHLLVVEPITEGLVNAVRALEQPPKVVSIHSSPTPIPSSLGLQEHWKTLRCGVPFGPGEPLLDHWLAEIAAHRRVWIPDPGLLSYTPLERVMEVVFELWEGGSCPGNLTQTARLSELLVAANGGEKPKMLRVPLSVALRKASLPSSHTAYWWH